MRQALITTCDNCGKTIKVYGRRAQALKFHFCNRDCSRDHQSKRMAELNRQLNPERMTEETRAKLREAHKDSGTGKTYAKTYGRHTHRVVAEQMLGRPLKKGEVVHHIDGNKRNNDPTNLMIFENQAAHAKFHKEHPTNEI